MIVSKSILNLNCNYQHKRRVCYDLSIITDKSNSTLIINGHDNSYNNKIYNFVINGSSINILYDNTLWLNYSIDIYKIYGIQMEYCLFTDLLCNSYYENQQNNYNIIYHDDRGTNSDYSIYEFDTSALIIFTHLVSTTFIPPQITDESVYLSILCIVCESFNADLSSIPNAIITQATQILPTFGISDPDKEFYSSMLLRNTIILFPLFSKLPV